MKFSERVYRLCKRIPKGKITTYKIVAEALKSKGYRAVGNVLNKNRNKDVPCHRIIDSKGHLHGFYSGIKNKERLLKKEGLKIKNKGVVDFEKYLYRF